jgi:hypothetical protein
MRIEDILFLSVKENYLMCGIFVSFCICVKCSLACIDSNLPENESGQNTSLYFSSFIISKMWWYSCCVNTIVVFTSQQNDFSQSRKIWFSQVAQSV